MKPTEALIDAVARGMAQLEPGEEWPVFTASGERDDEYYDSMHSEAETVVETAMPLIVEAVAEQIAQRLDAGMETWEPREAYAQGLRDGVVGAAQIARAYGKEEDE